MILALAEAHVRIAELGEDAAMESLAAGVAAVLALRPHPDAVLLSGDLADTAAPEEYERVRALLAPLPMPVHVLPGNHDDRTAMRAAFPLEGDVEPPFDGGMPAVDEIAMGAHDSAALAALLRRNPQVLRVLCGHTHRAAFAVVGGCGAFTAPGVHLTARLEIGAPGYEVVAEPPAFALHVLVGGSVTTHVQPIER